MPKFGEKTAGFFFSGGFYDIFELIIYEKIESTYESILMIIFRSFNFLLLCLNPAFAL